MARNNDILKMYEEELYKNEKLGRINEELKLELYLIKKENKNLNENIENKVNTAVEKRTRPLIKENEKLENKNKRLKRNIEDRIDAAVDKATKPLIEENTKLKEELDKALKEIDRLKSEKGQNYIVDKLTNQVNKNSSNSSIPTSKEIRKVKTGSNIYNHREKTKRKTGGQINHKGETLTKEKIEQKIKENNLKVVEIKHYIKGNSKTESKIKYSIGTKVETVIEKHIFIYGENYKGKMPKKYYSDVIYDESIKTLIVMLGNYYSLSYNKIQEFLRDLTNGIVNLSQGTIDNIYQSFSKEAMETINNITNNIVNGKYTHTDETVTSENGKESYYRGYGNEYNVLYKYHHKKGDKPIKEDNILPNYYGTIISDHEVGIFKYGTNNQDCVIHIGRYCKEQIQNVYEIIWPEKIFKLLLRAERNRKILSKFGREKFSEEEIKQIEKEYDDILEEAAKENEEILSTYWKEKANTLLRRLKKYKNSILFYIHDFSIAYDNNFMERALRMVKGKTKVSGGFRSEDGAIRFGNTMSIIKTARLRKLNVFDCIKSIFKGEALFA